MNNESSSNTMRSGGRRRGTTNVVDTRGYHLFGEEGKEVIYPTRVDCLKALLAGMARYPAARDKEFNPRCNYAGDFNSWLMASGFMFTSTAQKQWSTSSTREQYFECVRTIRWKTNEGLIECSVSGTGFNIKEALNKSCYQFWCRIQSKVPVVQSKDTTESNQCLEIEQKMAWVHFAHLNKRQGYKGVFPKVQIETPEKETEQGDVTQESSKASNTIITRDQQESKIQPNQGLDHVESVVSTEPFHNFPTVTQRWMPLGNQTISTSGKYNDVVKAWYLPEALYATNCSPSLIPFETFIYGRMDIELKIVVNANKFSCGKIVLSSKYDTYQADEISSKVQSALARNHIIVDLSTNNEGILAIPFRFHRPMVRLVQSDNASGGVRSGKYASAYLHILSPLQTGKDGPSDVSVTLFYRLKHSQFAGMSYRAKVQMMGIENVITPKTSRALKEVLAGAERAFDQLGKTSDQDKPGIIGATPVIPRPRLNFATGKGVTDVAPLRINPHTLTNYADVDIPDDEPKSFEQLARIWGVYKAFKWSNTQKSGDELGKFIIDPTSRSYDSDYQGELTPLEYAADNFAFWSGPIELRFDFVSNAYHTGTVQISAEFGRSTASANPCESQSTYTKTYHLGDQKTVNFTVPYIYDTIMRRSTGVMCNPYQNVDSSDDLSKQGLTIAALSRTVIKIRVVNALRPIASAPQNIEILVFMRAGKNFLFHGLKGLSLVQINSANVIDEFPYEYTQVSSSRAKRETGQLVVKPEPPGRYLPKDKANRWNEYKPEFLPQVQMDTGEKETLDQTADFNQSGPRRQVVNTLDGHMGFKDLLRKPVLLMWEVEVKPPDKVGAFFIPLMPPSRALCADPKTGVTTRYFAKSLSSTSTVAIMDMFRVWRGSMRYTIVVHDSKAKPLYVSLLPHSGVRLFGNHQVASNDGPYPFAGMNFITELVVPSVNPTMTIEVPYDTENTWTLTWDSDPKRVYSMRDKGDYNSGHLMITTHESIKCDVWWSAGDDFEVANFYGIPETLSNAYKYRRSDAPQVQMDFRPEETVTKVTGLVKSFCNVGTLGRAALGAIPIVGTPLVVADTINRIVDPINNMQREVQKTVVTTNQAISNANTNLTRVTNILDSTTTEITDLLRRAVDTVVQSFGGLVTGSVMLYDFMLDIIVAWMEKSWKVVGIAIVRFVSKLFVTSQSLWSNLMVYAGQLSIYLNELFSDVTPRVQSDTEEATLVGILAGLVGLITGVQMDRNRNNGTSFWRDLVKKLTNTSGVAYLLAVLRFIQAIFSTVKQLVMKALGYVSVEAQALRLLSESSEEIRKFVVEAQMMTSESNAVMVNTPAYRRRFWFTVLQAHKLQRIMCQIPTNAVSSQLSRLCSEVIKHGNERFTDISACPVRFEPMVIFLEGASGIGKSHMTEELVSRLLGAVNVNQYAAESIFYRTSGEKFWSGYRNQPVVVYDEWLNTTDSQRCTDQIAEMMKLKSTAMFIPEMAHLEEKKIRGNPLLIIVCCNDAFPSNLGDYARCVDATLRRREFVFHVEQKPEFEGIDYKHITDEQQRITQNYGHLQFRKYGNVKDEKSLNRIHKDFDTMSSWLVKEWKNYHYHEIQQVDKRMKRLPQYAEQVAGDMNLRDPFTIFYQINQEMMLDGEVQQNGWTPYEQLEQAVLEVQNALGAPIPLEQPNEELVAWELAQPPNVQIDLSGLTTALVWTATLPAVIAKATKRQLLLWEDSLMGDASAVKVCSICFEEVPISYACVDTIHNTGEAQHTICASCYRGLIEFGDGRCPQCRSERMLPVVNMNDLSRLTIWARLAVWSGRGIRWLCDRILGYYNWRQENPLLAHLTDFCIRVARLVSRNYTLETHPNGTLVNPEAFDPDATFTNTLVIDRMGHLGFMMWQMWGNDIGHVSPGVVQVDDDPWDEPSTSTAPLPVIDKKLDPFNFQVNEEIVENWFMKSEARPFCLHGKLLQHPLEVRMDGESWLVPDTENRVMLKIPFTCCESQCAITTADEYFQLIERYGLRNRSILRRQAIKLYNDPCQEFLEEIPLVFRPIWYSTIEIGVGDDWWTWLSEQWDNYKQTLAYIGAAVAVAGVVMKTYEVATSLLGMAEPVEVQNGATVGSPDPSPRHTRNIVLRRGGAVSYFQAETATPEILEVAEKYIARNTFKLYLRHNGKDCVMYGTGLFNHVLLIPRHYSREIRQRVSDGAQLFGHPLSAPQCKAPITLHSKMFVESKSQDIAYMCLPTKFAIFKDIRKFLATEDDLARPIPSTGILLGNPKCGSEFMREIEVDIQGIRDHQVILDQEDRSFEVRDVIVYNYSRPGSCGSLLLRPNHQRPILSMHFAGIGEGISGEGFGIILTQEVLSDLCTQNNVVVQFEDVSYESVEQAKFVYPEEIFLTYYGSVPPEKVPYIPTKSKLVKSLIYGAPDLEVAVEPAILDSKDPRYIHNTTPLFEGVKKHGLPTKDFCQDLVEEAGEALWDLWIQNMKPLVADPKILTDEEAIIGLDFPHYTPMDLKTSAGYPYNLDKTRTTKESWIKVGRDANLKAIGVNEMDPHLIGELQRKRLLRQQGIVPHTLFIDTLKDEKRPTNKARAVGGTRVFCSSPMDYVIECRKWFMHFVAAFMDQRFDLMHAVGIDPTSEEWSRLTNSLLRKNSKFGTIDYQNFGAGYNADVARKAYELIIRWTKEHVKSAKDHEREMWVIIYECLQSMHICNNTVYQQGTGSPSGAFFTTIINTLVNQMYLLIAWKSLTQDCLKAQTKMAFVEFRKHVQLYCYGDDGIFSVTPEYEKIYNMKTITSFFQEFGIVATDARKTGVEVAFEKVSEAQFLKRGFQPHPTRANQWLSPLKWESVLSATQWVWKSGNVKDSTYVNVEAALLQAHGHGKERFQTLKDMVNRCLRKAKCHTITASWEELDEKFYTVGLEFNTEMFLSNVMY